jgi:hypothetical protein
MSVSAIKTSPFKWWNFSRGSDEVYLHSDANGADTLTRMAVRAVVANRRGLDRGILEAVPWRPVGNAVWGELVRWYVYYSSFC